MTPEPVARHTANRASTVAASPEGKTKKAGARDPDCPPSVFGRGERIRTSDHLHPMQVRYQAALHPVVEFERIQQRPVQANAG